MSERTSPSPEQSNKPPYLADLVERLDNLTADYQAGQLTEPDYHRAAEPLERDIAAIRERLPLYEHEGETYHARQIRGPDDGPALADYIVRRGSDGRYGGYIADLAQDGDDTTYGPEDLRYEGYDDTGEYLAAACSLRGILSVFAQPDRHIRWINDRITDRDFEAER